MSTIRIEFGDGEKIEFGAGRRPDRKSPALIRVRGGMIQTLAYFRSEGCAEEFEEMLDHLVERINRNVEHA